MTDVHDSAVVVSSLLRLNSNSSSVTCLTFGEYVKNLILAKQAGKQSKLDNHLMPQQLACSDIMSQMPTIRGDVGFISAALRNLANFDFHPFQYLHEHPSPPKKKVIFKKLAVELCPVARDEYHALKLDIPIFVGSCIYLTSVHIASQQIKKVLELSSNRAVRRLPPLTAELFLPSLAGLCSRATAQ
jgi:hypothetical protein